MKKLLVSALLMSLMLSVTACGGKNEKVGSGTVNQIQNEADDAKDEGVEASTGAITKETLMSHEETPAEDFVAWIDEDGNMEINEYTGDDEIVVIPGEIDGKPVVRINAMVFANDSLVKAIRISNNVKELGDHICALNKKLQIVVCGNEVETIGESAFLNCENLVQIELNDGLKEIDEKAFAGCEKLQSVYIPDTANEIGMSAFGWLSPENFVIQGKTGSVAETYAQSEDIKFEAQ